MSSRVCFFLGCNMLFWKWACNVMFIRLVSRILADFLAGAESFGLGEVVLGG